MAVPIIPDYLADLHNQLGFVNENISSRTTTTDLGQLERALQNLRAEFGDVVSAFLLAVSSLSERRSEPDYPLQASSPSKATHSWEHRDPNYNSLVPTGLASPWAPPKEHYDNVSPIRVLALQLPCSEAPSTSYTKLPRQNSVKDTRSTLHSHSDTSHSLNFAEHIENVEIAAADECGTRLNHSGIQTDSTFVSFQVSPSPSRGASEPQYHEELSPEPSEPDLSEPDDGSESEDTQYHFEDVYPRRRKDVNIYSVLSDHCVTVESTESFNAPDLSENTAVSTNSSSSETIPFPSCLRGGAERFVDQVLLAMKRGLSCS